MYVFHVERHCHYSIGASDEKTLASFNSECEKKGCKNGIWK